VTAASEPIRRPGQARRSGRRGGDSGTREAILAAARARFGDLGYDRATIRGIADDAGVDPALVHHFYGSKDRLFAAAMRLPVNPGDVVDAVLASDARDEGSVGEHLLRTLLGIWDVAEMRATFLGLLRSASTGEQALGMLHEFVTSVIITRLAATIREVAPDGDGDADYRAALIASQVVGLGMTRYVVELDSLTRASTDDLAAAIGPTLDRYLSDRVRAGRDGAV
jgi:AcrR family transcriptional regulator